jgi:hypothetical protein
LSKYFCVLKFCGAFFLSFHCMKLTTPTYVVDKVQFFAKYFPLRVLICTFKNFFGCTLWRHWCFENKPKYVYYIHTDLYLPKLLYLERFWKYVHLCCMVSVRRYILLFYVCA